MEIPTGWELSRSWFDKLTTNGLIQQHCSVGMARSYLNHKNEVERMELSVVVPVHNEAENLEPLLDEIVHALENQCEYEIVYVDDGITDETLARLKTLRERFPRLRVLQL